MTGRARAIVAAALLSFVMACGGGGGDPAVDASPTAVPGMQGNVEPSIGVGVSEQPDN